MADFRTVPLRFTVTGSTVRSWLVLGTFWLGLCAVTTIWVSIDRRPPEWDHANHLERAVQCYRILSEPGHDRLREILEASAFYPPVTTCAAGILYFVFPIVPLTAQAVMLAFLAVGLAATFALGRHLFDPETGLLAALFLGSAPFVVYSLTNFQLDLPLMAMVAVALYVLVRTEGFSRPGWCAVLGVVLGLGMVTKPPFPGYVLPAFCWVLWQALRAGDRKRRIGRLLFALAIGTAIALPWYGPRILALPMQAAHRSFKFAAQEGQAEYLSAESILFYPRVLPAQLGPLVALLFLWGIWLVRRRRESRAFLWLASIAPFVVFSLIQNRNLRYTLPVLPAAALLAAVGARSLGAGRAVAWTCVLVGLLQIPMAAFAVPVPPTVPWLRTPLVVYQPPSRVDWRHDAVLADLVRATGGKPATVAVVPNYNFFSVSNFRYDITRLGLPFEMTRAWSDAPLGVDFVILKTGSQGPSFSVAKAERITKAFEGADPYLEEIFPVVAEYPLPDGSRGILRARRIRPLTGVAASALAERLQGSPARLLAANMRDPVGLQAHVDYRPEALLRGEVDRVTLEADAVVVGELKRKDRAPLRIREARLDVDGLVFNPRRLMETGQLELLGIRALRIQHLAVTEDDLRDFLRGQPGGVTVRLGNGAADVQVSRLGPMISARVHLLPGKGGSPFMLAADRVKVGLMPVPNLLTNWIVRQFDPSLALRRLPIPVVLSSISIVPGRIEVGR